MPDSNTTIPTDTSSTQATTAQTSQPPALDPNFGDKVLAAGREQVGLPYHLGGDGVTSTDCGMFTLMTYSKVGIDLTIRTADDQAKLCNDNGLFFTNPDAAKKGDLIFFKHTYNPGEYCWNDITHVGIYEGPETGLILQASSKGVNEDYTIESFGCEVAGFGRIANNGPLAGNAMAANARLSTSKGTSNSSGIKSSLVKHGTHADTLLQVNPPGKTFSEPVYPDLIAIKGKAPTTIVENQKAPADASTANPDGTVTITLDDLQKYCNVDLTGVLGDAEEIKKRNETFNPDSIRDKKKAANAGKPLNNNDPYPVDQKIRELEKHMPRIKIDKIQLCGPSAADITIASDLLLAADRAEKRIVKLENMMSTIQRYLFALSSRVHINCVYYGGQDKYEKYKCIRCLHDDRINDGQSMSLDQCLSCTRYEPIIGQVYDIANEFGLSLGVIQDDIQMAYMTVPDYVEFARAEKFHNELPKAQLDPNNLTTKDASLKDFKETWKAGNKMDWHLVPVEQQKPLVNWRQDINSDDKELPLLDSDQGNSVNIGSSTSNGGYTSLNAGNLLSYMQANYQAMASATDSSVAAVVKAAQEHAAGQVDSALENMQTYGYESAIREVASSTGVDPLMILAIIAQESGGNPNHPTGMMQTDATTYSSGDYKGMIAGGVAVYQQKMEAMGTSNPVFVACAYNWGEGVAGNILENDSSLSLDTATWVQAFDAIVKAATSTYPNQPHRIEYFADVCFEYMLLKDRSGFSPLDNKDSHTTFPISGNDLAKTTFSADYGVQKQDDNGAVTTLNGVQLSAPGGTQVCSIADGYVTQINGDTIQISHGNGLISEYHYMGSINVKLNDKVTQSQPIGTVGGDGKVQLNVQQDGKYEDPKVMFPLLSGKLGKTLG